MTLRSPRQFWAGAGILLGLAWGISAYAALALGVAARPILVTLVGLPHGAVADVHVEAITAADVPVDADRVLAKEPSWGVERTWVQALRLRISKGAWEPLKRVEVCIGSETFTFGRDRIAQESLEHDGERRGDFVFQFPGSVRANHSRISRFDRYMNWPGDATFLGLFLPVTILAGAGITLALRLRNREWSDMLLRFTGVSGETTSPSRRGGMAWAVGGLGFLIVALTLLEIKFPRYFSQDDNFSQFLPVMIQGGAALSDGVFPTWNPYQMLGAPTASVGVYALTYPPTYLSYFVARYLLGDVNLTIEVFCILHTVAGYFAAFWCARVVGLRPALACLGSLSFVLSGYQLIAGRCWYYMTPVALYAPLLVGALALLVRQRPTWRWVVGTALAIGLFFHAGNAQMWAYMMLLLGFAWFVLVVTGALPLRRTLTAITAGLLGLAVCAPLLVAQALATRDLDRQGGGGGGIGRGLAALLLPYPLIDTSHPNGWDADQIQMGHLYYSGTVFVGAGLLAGLAIVFALAIFHWDAIELRRLAAANAWMLCGLVAFLLALGDPGVLWPALCRLPVFDKFTFPFKFLPYLNLFLVLGGGLFLERAIPKGLQGRAIIASGAALVGGLLLYHCGLAQGTFYSFHERTYAPLPSPLAAVLKDDGPARLWSISPLRSPAHDYVSSLQHNFATVYEFPSLQGYDPLVAASPENRRVNDRLRAAPLEAAYAYGVRWLVVHRLASEPEFGPGEFFKKLEQLSPDLVQALPIVERHARAVLTLPEVTVLELSGAAPLAFADTAPEISRPIRLTAAGAHVDVSTVVGGGKIVVNFLRRPETVATVDGQSLDTTADEWGRIVVQVPAGSRTLAIRHAPPWDKGFLVASLLAVLAGGVFWLQSREVGASSDSATKVSPAEPSAADAGATPTPWARWTNQVGLIMLGAMGLYVGLVLWSGSDDMRATLRQFPVGDRLPAVLGLVLCGWMLRAVRWHIFVRQLGWPVPTVASYLVFLASFAFTVTPGKAGEVVKSALLKRRYGVPVAESAAVLLVERVHDLLAVLLLAGGGLVLYRHAWLYLLVGAVLIGAGMACAMCEGLQNSLLTTMSRVTRLRPWAERLGMLFATSRSLLRPVPFAAGLALALVAWACEALALHVLLTGLGADVSVVGASFVYGLATLAGALSMLPGGLGGMEATMLFLLGGLGVDRPSAVAATVLLRACSLWLVTLLGMAFLGLWALSADAVPTPVGEAQS